MPRTPSRTLRTAARLFGAGGLLASGGIHLDLYITGYHAIPTIGPLFLVQTISALALGLVLAIRADEILSAGGALLAVGTLGGYVASRAIGLFGFREVPTTGGLSAGLLDTVAFVALGYFATTRVSATEPSSEEQASAPHSGMKPRIEGLMISSPMRAGVVVLGIGALVVALVEGMGGSQSPTSTASSTPTGSASGSKSVTITIDNFAFTPAHVTVAPHERIVVHNEDPVAHTLTATPGSSPFGAFTTGNIGPGQTKLLTAPATSGTFQYYCAIHNYMTGSITVKS